MIYLASLVVMLITAFWSVNPFTNHLEHNWTLENFRQVFTATYLRIIWRTILLAAAVTVTDAILACPVRIFHGASRITPRSEPAVHGGLFPLWASYLAASTRGS